MNNIIEIILTDERTVKYKKRCKHQNKKYIETIDTYDMDDYPVQKDVYICLDCGITWEQ